MRATTEEREKVLEVRDLTMRFGDKLVHAHLDLAVFRGEILSIVGASGSGKSTLLREMVLLRQPTSGSVRILGQEITGLNESQVLHLRRHIGVLFQNGALFGGLNVRENVAIPLREHTGLSDNLIDEIACVKLGLVGLTPTDGLLYPSQLSGGMRKRAALARALALDPDILFLDEPTSGLDPIGADAFDDLILELKTALGPTIVIVTHDMDSLWRVADRVALLGDARLLALGSVDELACSTDPAVERFFHGPRGRAAARVAASAAPASTTRPAYLLAGVFVLVLTGALIAGVLWLSAGGPGQVYDEYLVYMQESVSGLSRDSTVKYYGVDVGRVHEISLGPGDPKRVRLLLEIDRGTPIREDTVAKIETQGLTGLSYINLSGGSDTAALLAAEPGAAWPEIRSEPSVWGRLDRSLERLIDNLVDASQRLSAVMSDENRATVTDILAQLDVLSHALADRSETLASTIDDVAGTAQKAREAGERLPELVRRFEAAAGALEDMATKVGAAGSSVRETLEVRDRDIAQFTRQTLPEIAALVREMRVAAESFRRFSETLERDPRVLFQGTARGRPGPGE